MSARNLGKSFGAIWGAQGHTIGTKGSLQEGHRGTVGLPKGLPTEVPGESLTTHSGERASEQNPRSYYHIHPMILAFGEGLGRTSSGRREGEETKTGPIVADRRAWMTRGRPRGGRRGAKGARNALDSLSLTFPGLIMYV